MIVLNKRAEIDKLLVGREDLKGGLLYSRSVSFVYEVLNLPYWKDSRFKKLLTPNIWRSSIYDIVNILSMKEWDEPKFTELLTSNIWHSNYTNVKIILKMSWFDDPRYDGLLTSSIWQSSPEKIDKVLSMDPITFFNKANELMVKNPPADADKEMLEKIAAVNIGPGMEFDISVLTGDVAENWKTMLTEIQLKLIKEGQKFSKKPAAAGISC